jgi:phosphoglycerate kinase
MDDVSLNGKKVLIREDYNVPLKNGQIIADMRIRASLPTLQQSLAAGAKVMIMSHLGRPECNVYDENFSLAPVAERLTQLLGFAVPLIKDWLDGVTTDSPLVLLENVRFIAGESTNDTNVAQKMAALCDVFIMDAFATAHRQEASVCGVIKYAPIACAGKLFMAEIKALNDIMANSAKPLLAIVGGAKISTKLSLLESLIKKVDILLIGGGLANTFFACQGYPVGQSLYEKDLLDEAERLLIMAKEHNIILPLASDVLVSGREQGKQTPGIRLVSAVDHNEKIMDLGPDTIKQWLDFIKQAKIILWNGPVGAFETAEFSQGTKQIAHAVADSQAFVVAGGGDTLAAIEKYNLAEKIDYISTGGGAFLAFFEGKSLPAIVALEQRYL